MVVLNYIIAGFIGIIIYQIICMIVYIVTNENDTVMSIMGMLIPFAVWSYLIQPIIYKIVLTYYRKNYNYYRFCYTKSDGSKDKSCRTFYAHVKTVKDFSQNENDKYYIELVRSGKDFKSVPYGCEIYKGQDSFNDWNMNLFKKHGVEQ